MTTTWRSVPSIDRDPQEPRPLELLDEIQRRVLWLAVRMVDAANHDRPQTGSIKVGGHQASSASLVTVMTALWFDFLAPDDRVSVKPHASPVFHAIQYLLGGLDRRYLTSLRARGGLQAYPSRTKDPDPVDFSTGSVGLGAAAPLFAAVARRYVDAHFGARPRSRFISILGDAELDEGNVWEAVDDPATEGLGNVLWIVDVNRQSLDRVIPGVRIAQWKQQFSAAGWHVYEAKYGVKLREKYSERGGEVLRAWIDAMSNEQYQSLFRLAPDAVRVRFLENAPSAVAKLLEEVSDAELATLVTDLGGHDLQTLLDAFAVCDAVTDRPSVLFAYTIKGWGLPNAGDPRNHAALLRPEQIADLRDVLGLTEATEWDRFDPSTAPGTLVELRRAVMFGSSPEHPHDTADVVIPPSTAVSVARSVSTQEVFGRVLVELARNSDLAPYLVTTAPDVATSTSLAGFINRCGVFAPEPRRSWNEDPILKWAEGPSGQHIELGISEMNLFLLLGQLGLSAELSHQRLLPVGTVYDPFVCRGLDAFIYSLYSESRFVVAGTPSGVTLAPEGGAHQSTITTSIGLELPNCTLIEPAYGRALDWALCDALARIARSDPDTRAFYFRLTTRPIDQTPFNQAVERVGEAALREQVLAGGYRLVDGAGRAPGDAPMVYLAASGAVLPEVLAAADELATEGVLAHVIDITSLALLYSDWQRSVRTAVQHATMPRLSQRFAALFEPPAPIVTIHDAASHAMAWLGSALGMPAVSLGVDEFGQSGSIEELYEVHDLVPGRIVNAALGALELADARRG